ncbi:MAG: hypothetical protein ACLQDI_22410, partial [Syntrophobacteraceae bacterium]
KLAPVSFTLCFDMRPCEKHRNQGTCTSQRYYYQIPVEQVSRDRIIAAVEKNRFWEYYYWLWDLTLNGLKF